MLNLRTHAVGKATAVIMAGLLAFPSTAFGAEWVGVGDQTYNEAANGEGAYGGTWSWDGLNDMVLNEYNGDPISAEGDLNINLQGDNYIGTTSTGYFADGSVGIMDRVDDNGSADLTISGDGTLSIGAAEAADPANAENTFAVGIYSGGSVTIDGTTVAVDFSDSQIGSTEGIASTGSEGITIENGAHVSVDVSGDTYNRGGDYGWAGVNAWDNGGVTITDSTVTSNSSSGFAITGSMTPNYGSDDDANLKNTAGAGVTITNSEVTATGTEHAIYSASAMTITNSKVEAQATDALPTGVVSAQATSASQGAGVAAAGEIKLVDVDMGSVTVATDTDTGISYIVDTETGTTGTIATKNTGEASKYVNGVGQSKTELPATGTRSKATANRTSGTTGTATTDGTGSAVASRTLANTGGGISDLATAITSDPTTFTSVMATFAGGILLTVTGFARRRRSE